MFVHKEAGRTELIQEEAIVRTLHSPRRAFDDARLAFSVEVIVRTWLEHGRVHELTYLLECRVHAVVFVLRVKWYRAEHVRVKADAMQTVGAALLVDGWKAAVPDVVAGLQKVRVVLKALQPAGFPSKKSFLGPNTGGQRSWPSGIPVGLVTGSGRSPLAGIPMSQPCPPGLSAGPPEGLDCLGEKRGNEKPSEAPNAFEIYKRIVIGTGEEQLLKG